MRTFAPGATIGILGGGQLGRMMAMAAAQLGYTAHVYAPEPRGESVAAQVSAAYTQGAYDDEAALAAFARQVAVVTYEFENVAAAPLAAILPHAALFPPARALEVAQDRVNEKSFVEALGGRPAPWMAVDGPEDLARAVATIGAPGILKTRRDGYDGKGQWRIMAPADAAGIDLPAVPLIYEGFVHFFGEFSVILVRGQDGQVQFWDSAQNEHESGILARSTVPAPAQIAGQVPAARALAEKVAQALDYVGVLTLEFFATHDGPVFNEMAPRVHNSGHWSIEGALASQFENHVRAILGLPLGSTGLVTAGAVMDNLIGDAALAWPELLADPANHLHLYGKAETRPGRKMGHVTRLVR
ncbi:5-(carboxyamino)imidazole ribonucleotide synthase [Novosphingobium sp. SG720]|uniref:5-(carboxyamino)imidazole ribonucleotide synthase n=1 Tax=Novosphingobium TaxID=165696 RepID=UPI001446A7C0|nr:5-(carboxyamino)imidazole ribonucleotide synthase [Novosphingobium sp. SG720]NKJ42808.1 5-(carboxyamino)imidazole ribonucleotide synthase [Novosphingobium sp. SG720]